MVSGDRIRIMLPSGPGGADNFVLGLGLDLTTDLVRPCLTSFGFVSGLLWFKCPCHRTRRTRRELHTCVAEARRDPAPPDPCA